MVRLVTGEDSTNRCRGLTILRKMVNEPLQMVHRGNAHFDQKRVLTCHTMAFQQLGIPCPRPAGGFYLYPNFSPWCPALLERGIRTSQDLARYLLEECGMATLPGSAFNEESLVLRLRLSTSHLFEPEHAASPEEREAAFWNLLDQAEALQLTDEKRQFTPSLPALERAQARWTEVIQALPD